VQAREECSSSRQVCELFLCFSLPVPPSSIVCGGGFRKKRTETAIVGRFNGKLLLSGVNRGRSPQTENSLKIGGVSTSSGQHLVGYLANASGPVSLVLDLRIAHLTVSEVPLT